MKKVFMIIVMIVILASILGCVKVLPPEDELTYEATIKEADVQAVEDLPETKDTAEVAQDVVEIEQDLVDEELDNLDKELDELDW